MVKNKKRYTFQKATNRYDKNNDNDNSKVDTKEKKKRMTNIFRQSCSLL